MFKILFFSLLVTLSYSNNMASPNASPKDVPTKTTTSQTDFTSEITAATARPADGLSTQDDGLALSNNELAATETTPSTETTTVSETTPSTTTTTSTTTITAATMESLPDKPQTTSQTSPKPKAAEAVYYGYRSSYPNLSPYGTYYPYGAPSFHQHHLHSPHSPKFSPGFPQGYSTYRNPTAESDSVETSKKGDSAKDIGKDSDTDEKSSEHPHFDYPPPPVYVVQRRPFLPSYPYGVPARGYGLPYGYGR